MFICQCLDFLVCLLFFQFFTNVSLVYLVCEQWRMGERDEKKSECVYVCVFVDLSGNVFISLVLHLFVPLCLSLQSQILLVYYLYPCVFLFFQASHFSWFLYVCSILSFLLCLTLFCFISVVSCLSFFLSTSHILLFFPQVSRARPVSVQVWPVLRCGQVKYWMSVVVWMRSGGHFHPPCVTFHY